MSILKGYQNTHPDLQKSGVTVTQSGMSYDLLNFTINDVDLRLVATSLSRIARYLGHTQGFYSVAQHCVRGAEALLLTGQLSAAWAFLHHDASEAYTGDISAPLKRLLKPILKEIEEKIEMAIAERWNIIYPYPEVVHEIDRNLAQEEMTLLMHSALGDQFDYWDSERAEREFLLTRERLQVILSYQEKPLV